MSDVIFVAVVIAFFAVAVAYVKGCERIVGPDDVVRVPSDDGSSDEPADEVAVG